MAGLPPETAMQQTTYLPSEVEQELASRAGELAEIGPPAEFPLGELLPGRYEIRATVAGRFESAPHVVKVERPNLRRARRG